MSTLRQPRDVGMEIADPQRQTEGSYQHPLWKTLQWLLTNRQPLRPQRLAEGCPPLRKCLAMKGVHRLGYLPTTARCQMQRHQNRRQSHLIWMSKRWWKIYSVKVVRQMTILAAAAAVSTSQASGATSTLTLNAKTATPATATPTHQSHLLQQQPMCRPQRPTVDDNVHITAQ